MDKGSANRASNLMKLARRESLRFNHEYLSTEHILLGLLRLEEGIAAEILKNHGITYTRVREVLPLHGFGVVGVENNLNSDRYVPPHNPRAKRVIDLAVEEARLLDHKAIHTEHVLLGLLREPEGVGGQVLRRLGLTWEQGREEVIKLNPPGMAAIFTLPDEPSLRPEHSASKSQSVPDQSPSDPRTREIDAEIERLNREKEAAVMEQNFVRALSFRDQVQELQRQRDEILSKPPM